LGHAFNWDNAARNVGIAVDKFPLPQDVAYWNASPTMPKGHVAWVEKVHYDYWGNPTGIEISEYNFIPSCSLSSRSINETELKVDGSTGKYPDGFIHILAYKEGISSLFYLDSYEMCCAGGNYQTKDEWEMIVKKTWNEYRCTSNCGSIYNSEDLLAYAEYVGGLGGGDDLGGGTPNPYTQSTDIHINYGKIRPYKEGSWHHEVDVDMDPGQTFFFELEGMVENESNYDLDDVDIDYCFVKDNKDFDAQTRRCLDDDHADIKEGERETKHSRRSRVVIANDLSQITVYTDGGNSFNLPITQENLDDEEITLYFYLDVETEDDEDRDVSSEAKTDEYAKLEIHLNIPQPPPPELNLSVPFDQEYIRNKTKTVFVGQTIEIPITINKSGQDSLAYYTEVSLTLSGPEFQTPQILIPLSADILDLNTNGEDILTVQIDSIDNSGDYYLEVCVDPQDYITETNEDDNCNYVYFVVKKRKTLTPIINLLLQSN